MTICEELPSVAGDAPLGGDDAGEWLVTHRDEMDRGEARWLLMLGDFDAALGWSLDGQLSCVEWLMLRTSMGRATAFEKVRIARALRRRAGLAEAFCEGRVSYSAVRAITRTRVSTLPW
ncbi:MAG: hypothetical protein ACYC1D_08970 [Acidimicrobiales bacterium]